MRCSPRFDHPSFRGKCAAHLLPDATTQLLWGWVARRLGSSKWVTGIGNLVTVLLTMLIPTAAPHFPLVILTRILIGVAEAPFFPCVTQLYSSWIPPAEMGTAVTVGYNGTLAGTVLVFFCTPLIIKCTLRSQRSERSVMCAVSRSE